MKGFFLNKFLNPVGGRGGINWSSYWTTRKPSALIVTGMRDTEIDFSWTDNSSGDCSFKVYKSTDGVTYAADGTTVAGDTTYTATGLTAGALYYFYVVGVKSANESDPTNIYDTRFKITVDTTKAGSANDSFILPTAGAGTYDYYVDWGDGGAEEHIEVNTSQTHDYNATGEFQIKIRGTFPRIYFNGGGDAAKLISIDNWGNIHWTSFQNSFFGCSNMTGTYIDVPNTSVITTTGYASMFRGCGLFNSPVIFDMSRATSVSYMFYQCAKFNQSVSTWVTTNMTSMERLFSDCTLFNQSVSNFNTVNVENMTYLFGSCTSFNQSVSNFNTAKVTNMAGMFYSCLAFNQSVANFNTEKVTAMNGMFFRNDVFNQDVSGWNFEAITGTGLSGFITNLSPVYSTAYYDALLIALAAQDVNDTVTMVVEATYTPGGDAAAARAHLVDTHSWAITDDGTSFSDGLLVLNFDDGGASQYTAYEDLVTQGEKATFYIISSIIGVSPQLSWAQLQTMHAAGMDIQCHTYDHTVLTTLSEAQVYAEYDDLDAQFVANSLPAANHTSYPFGGVNTNVKTWTATKRLTGRDVNVGYVFPSSDKYMLKTYGMDINTDYDALKAAILVAKNNKWGIMAYGHGINGSQIPRDKFNEVIDYAQSIGMSIVTVSEMYAQMT